ncbi:MAG TPA: Crp/Fnr family transcriptional regulator [Candidatus Sulfotelmatobacter sp.]|nr:Crp/Fnr family transcriptional regulator [Candidatus Sulfotelmatobacter sp.]
MRGDQFFCDFSVRCLECLNGLKCSCKRTKGEQLFTEGQPADGIFVLCSGRAKLSMASYEGRTIIINISEAGDVLGLNAVISDRPYEVTAELMKPGQDAFIPRPLLLQFMKDNEEVAMHVTEHLSGSYYTAHEAIRSVGLASNPAQRLAKLLLSLCPNTPEEDDGEDSLLGLTHQEIADILGLSRQTVTREFSEFRKEGLLQVSGSSHWICDRLALGEIAQL